MAPAKLSAPLRVAMESMESKLLAKMEEMTTKMEILDKRLGQQGDHISQVSSKVNLAMDSLGKMQQLSLAQAIKSKAPLQVEIPIHTSGGILGTLPGNSSNISGASKPPLHSPPTVTIMPFTCRESEDGANLAEQRVIGALLVMGVEGNHISLKWNFVNFQAAMFAFG